MKRVVTTAFWVAAFYGGTHLPIWLDQSQWWHLVGFVVLMGTAMRWMYGWSRWELG